MKDVKVDVKELWFIEPEGGGCEGAVVLDTADEGCKGGCEGAVVYRASSWWM